MAVQGTVGDILVLGQELIEQFLNGIKQEMIDYLDTNNRNATGQSKRSLQVVNLTPTSGQLIGNDGIEFVFNGRGPGGFPPLSKIIEWCYARGLPRAVAWVIAKRIAEAGTKLWQSGRRPLDEILNEQAIAEFTASLTKVYTANIETELNLIFAA